MLERAGRGRQAGSDGTMAVLLGHKEQSPQVSLQQGCFSGVGNSLPVSSILTICRPSLVQITSSVT